MIPDELRRRLESLNRAPLPGDSHHGGSLSTVRGTPAKGAPRRIEELFAGRQVVIPRMLIRLKRLKKQSNTVQWELVYVVPNECLMMLIVCLLLLT